MLFLAVVTVALMIGCLAVLWPYTRDSGEATSRKPSKGQGRAAAREQGVPESLEGVLTGQVISGDITRGQYRRAMAGVAEREDVRRPLRVPPDVVPPGT